MDTCGKCGGELRMQPISRYEPKKEMAGGIKVVLVNDAVSGLVCQKCGNITKVDIPNLPGLIAAIAVCRSTEPTKLSGKEIRFLRRAMERTAKELAGDLDVTEETVSRWENDRLAISTATERLLRYQVCLRLGDKAPAVDFEPEHVLYGMKIRAVRDAGEEATLMFWRTPSKKREAVWKERAVA